jgi:hypothetical protein
VRHFVTQLSEGAERTLEELPAIAQLAVEILLDHKANQVREIELLHDREFESFVSIRLVTSLDLVILLMCCAPEGECEYVFVLAVPGQELAHPYLELADQTEEPNLDRTSIQIHDRDEPNDIAGVGEEKEEAGLVGQTPDNISDLCVERKKVCLRNISSAHLRIIVPTKRVKVRVDRGIGLDRQDIEALLGHDASGMLLARVALLQGGPTVAADSGDGCCE